MYYVYVLRSKNYGNRYVGSTEDVTNRLGEHNLGKVRYTKGRKPWKLIHTEEYETGTDARKRELFLKSGKGREFLDKLLGGRLTVG